MALAILDRPAGSAAADLRDPVWRTCLREVWFGQTDASWATAADALIDGDAYARLLEIICGLRSPLIGETQVLGQFKAFLATVDDSHAWLRVIGQRLLTDARNIRARHLHHLGSRTYGSAVRRYVAECPVIALIGGGALAQEIIPFLSRAARIDQWTRRAVDGPTGERVRPLLLSDAGNVAIDAACAALVIAAPAPDAVIATVASRYERLVTVVDLRAEAAANAKDAAPSVRWIPLAQVFADRAAAAVATSSQLAAAHAEIRLRSREFDRAELVRPFGWDDLCA